MNPIFEVLDTRPWQLFGCWVVVWTCAMVVYGALMAAGRGDDGR